MRSFDPDEETTLPEPGDEGGVQLRDDVADVDVNAALELLERVTRDLPGGGERREGQREMLRLVAGALSQRTHLVIQAGTGVGKSLAYLIPAILSGERVVVATATKNLQDQLAANDAPQLRHHVAQLRVAVLKGRQNYLCRNRAAHVGGGAQLSLDDGSDAPKSVTDQTKRLLRWMDETTTGDRDELTFEVDARAWRALSVTPQECLGRAKCPQGANCFSELARDRAAESQIVIVNAHLYASHLASGSMLLPAHEYVVFDEAHEIRDIFATLLGTSLNATRLHAVASLGRSLLTSAARSFFDEFDDAVQRLASALNEQFAADHLRGLDEAPALALAKVSELTTALVERVREHPSLDADEEARKTRVLGPTVHVLNDLERLRRVRGEELLFLSKRGNDVDLELSLIDVGPRLAEDLWGQVTAVLTSATIPDALPRQLGLGELTVTRVASPFDYEHHALLYVPSDFPSRNDPSAETAIINELVELIGAAGGRTLALFTNRAVMARVAEAVAAKIDTPVLVQGGLSRQRLLNEFRTNDEASLFAVTSFWQGVDVPGHSLSLVTIDRLPFSVPNDPLAEARRERAANPFYEVDLPRATMLLAQGVGRLIRSASDRGVVAVLDTRLATSSYRSTMFRSLPPMKRTRDRALVTAFLRELRAPSPEA
ncbi:MAG: ATP-dependent DNA helicase [Acidobacteriota bacterium]|nr:ATP-dependent DNA helicase [Acidobacteriota bacterium]